ncbi:MAG: hypothetical protein ACI9CE_000108 [Flavobacterium sp.]|jgi:hypothetical protein
MLEIVIFSLAKHASSYCQSRNVVVQNVGNGGLQLCKIVAKWQNLFLKFMAHTHRCPGFLHSPNTALSGRLLVAQAAKGRPERMTEVVRDRAA